MYAKLFGRITESSLMEEPLEVRYSFMMLLAIAAPDGAVIGTDVAIARRLNISTEDFQRCMKALMSPDPNSNSKEHEGRRVIQNDGERGYLIVNYVTYREFRDKESRRIYMREYMRNAREAKDSCKQKVLTVNSEKLTVNSCKPCKPPLAQEEEEGELEAEGEENTHSRAVASAPELFESFWKAYPKKVAKDKCLSLFKSKNCASVFDSVMSGLMRDKASDDWTKERGQFIPHPSTWLNQRRWESVLEVPTKTAAETQAYAETQSEDPDLFLTPRQMLERTLAEQAEEEIRLSTPHSPETWK